MSPQIKGMHQWRELNNNNLDIQEMRWMNKEITRYIRKDVRYYNKMHIQRIIKQNKGLQILRS